MNPASRSSPLGPGGKPNGSRENAYPHLPPKLPFFRLIRQIDDHRGDISGGFLRVGAGEAVAVSQSSERRPTTHCETSRIQNLPNE